MSTEQPGTPKDTAKPLTVALVEDDPGLRLSIQTIVESSQDMQFVGAFASAEEAAKEIPSVQPAVVLMDINLPRASGVDCVTALSPKLPHAQFIMLTVYDDPEAIFDSLAAGAVGYLRKPMEPTELLEAIRDAHKGGAPMSSSIARRVIQAFRKAPQHPLPSTGGKAAVLEKLAPRERQILDLLAKGYLQKEIADQLGISFSTVRTLTGRIYEKLHVHSRSQAVFKYLGTETAPE